MNSSELLALYRTEMLDDAEPPLWSDAEIYGFIDHAQVEFCRNTSGIADARTASVTRLSIVPGTDWYTTHRSILNVRHAARTDTGRRVELLSAEQADRAGVVFLPTLLGPVKALVLGLEPHAVRVTPMPNETVGIQLAVYRMPLITITDDRDQALEIDAKHHVALLLWMKHRGYDKQDAETFDRRKSDEFKDRFMAYCFKAKQEEERARRVLGNVIYGGL